MQKKKRAEAWGLAENRKGNKISKQGREELAFSLVGGTPHLGRVWALPVTVTVTAP
jgi:hypothetical protein